MMKEAAKVRLVLVRKYSALSTNSPINQPTHSIKPKTKKAAPHDAAHPFAVAVGFGRRRAAAAVGAAAAQRVPRARAAAGVFVTWVCLCVW
jgi:hypothetical protein